MSKIKKIIRRTPLIKIWRRALRKRDEIRQEKFNAEYRKFIDPLMDPAVLKCRIDQLTDALQKTSCTYYVISLRNDRIGIFGYIDNILPHIAYAVSRGYVPVIDMKNYPSLYQTADENAWEKFFEQPCGVTLEDIVNQRVIYAPNEFWYRWQPNSCPLMTNTEISMWGTLYNQYIKCNTQSIQYLLAEQNSILAQSEKTVGALYRGTDYTKGHPIGHPIQPSMKKFADKVAEVMERNGCEYIYLASDEKGIVEYMNVRFPGKVLINKRVFYDEAKNVDYSNYNTDHIGVSGAHFDREDNEYLIGIEYISSMNLVSNCVAFVAGACGGTTAVLCMNNLRFREQYIFNLGKYGYDPIPEEE